MAAQGDSPLELTVRIKKSQRRQKTISARWRDNNTIEVSAPASIDDEALQLAVENLKRRLIAAREKLNAPLDDQALEERARALNKKYFSDRLRWRSIRFVTNQNKRFGSCTPKQGTIRISHRLASAPAWVLDYVIMHELTHLLEANHSQKFWRIVQRYPLTERARGYLIALSLEKDSVD